MECAINIIIIYINPSYILQVKHGHWMSELFTTVAPATSVSQSMLVRNKMQAETPERYA